MEGQEQYDRATKAQAQAVGMQNNSLHGALGGSSTNIASPYQILIDQLSGVIGRAEMINNVIGNIDRRLHGSYPEPDPAEIGQEKSAPNGYMEEVSYQMERLIIIINKAEDAANKLDGRVNI